MEPVDTTIVDKDGDEALYVEPKDGATDEQADAPEKGVEEPSEVKTEEVVPTKIKIGEQEYDETELQEIVNKGSKIKEWETKMPGFDVDKFMPDYTRKSQRLAEMEKRLTPKEQVPLKSLEDLGVDDAQVKAFEAVAKHLGYIRNSDLVTDSVEAQKEAFLSRHPEYAPGNPVGDAKWGQLMQEFSVYDWKNHPGKVESLLEKTHGEISKTWGEEERGKKVQETIATRKAQAVASATGGGSGRGGAVVASTQPISNAAEIARKHGWTEEQIKELF